jgi:aryl-alcohol dehydrogenase-like predicted oxidoreductase
MPTLEGGNMQYGTVSGISKPVSRLVQGTIMISTSERDRSFQLLDDIFEQGCNTFDTAHVYGRGDCERVLGQWVHERGLRERVVIITKGAHPNDVRRRVTPFDITADLFDSLARLQIDYVDLYLLHRDDPSVPVGPIVDVLNEHYQAGRIHAFGGSNWTAERIQEANTYANEKGLVPFIASSPNFSLAEQVKPPWKGCISISGEQGKSARAWYEQEAMALFTWSSLAGGFFSGRFSPENFLQQFEDPMDRVCVESYCYQENFQRLDRARQLASTKGLTVSQVAMAYVLSQPFNVFAIIGCKTGDEFQENLNASTLKLSSDEMAWLESGDAA